MALKKAGLVNVKQSSRYMLTPIEAVRGKNATSVEKQAVFRGNLMDVLPRGPFTYLSRRKAEECCDRNRVTTSS